jgi:hypothetical protein
MQKFTVTVREIDGKFHKVIRNRRGREWVSKVGESCPGNAAESAMFYDEVLNSGGKLSIPEAWEEVA